MSTYVNAPWVCGGVDHCLQISRNALPLRQQLRQGLGSKNVPEHRYLIVALSYEVSNIIQHDELAFQESYQS